MTDRSRGARGRQLLVEAVLIVGSILLAFAIDAAWEGREMRRQELELLESLRVDFERNGELLAGAEAAHVQHRVAAQSFLDLTGPSVDVADSRVSDADLISLVSWTTYDPVLGSLDSAIASGQLRLISNARLQAELAGWIDLVEDLNETEGADRAHAGRFAEVAFEFVPFRSAVHRLGDRSVGGPSAVPGDYRGLMGSLVLENIAANRVAEVGFVLDDLEGVRASLDRILALIETELS